MLNNLFVINRIYIFPGLYLYSKACFRSTWIVDWKLSDVWSFRLYLFMHVQHAERTLRVEDGTFRLIMRDCSRTFCYLGFMRKVLSTSYWHFVLYLLTIGWRLVSTLSDWAWPEKIKIIHIAEYIQICINHILDI